MSGVDAAFEGAWGKRTEFADRVTYFPLRDHCADVAAVVEALLALPTIRKGRVRQGGVISAVAVGHRQAALAVMCRG
ncbi:HD domain-containing protein [Parapedomonas caeni]